MSNLAVNVEFRELMRLCEGGKMSQSQAITAPLRYHAEIVEEIGLRLLSNYRPSHPDMLILGSVTKPPTVDECRYMIEEITVKPFEGERRIAVIESADKLNKSAGNALLKLTEEPPSHAYILYMMEDGRLFMPTLRSRVHSTVIGEVAEISVEIMPQDAQEWVDWLTEARKSTNDDGKILSDITSWEGYEYERGNVYMAYRLERLRQLALRKSISIPMLSDVVLMTLNDGENMDEYIFNDIW